MGFRDAFRGLFGEGSGEREGSPEPDLSGDWEIVGGDVVEDPDADGRGEPGRDRPGIEEFPPGEAAEALAAQWPGYELDFSPASLARIDDLLDAELSPSQYAVYEFRLGAYLGEVLVRNHDARWTPTDEVGWVVEIPDEVGDATVVEFGEPVQEGLWGDVSFAGVYEQLVTELELDEPSNGAAAKPGAREPETSERTFEASQEPVEPSDDEDASTVEYYRERAERIAWAWPGYDLDFSVQSLVRLDRLVAQEVESREGMPADEFAGYLAEIFRRHHDAAWKRDRGQAVLVVRGETELAELTPEALAAAREDPEGSFVNTYAHIAADLGLRTLADEE